MSFFSDEITRERLSLLYLLDALDLELTKEQISAITAENDIMPYFELQTLILELEGNGFIAGLPRAFGQVYCITERAKEVLKLFSNRLPASLRSEYDRYCESNRDRIKLMTQYMSSIEKTVSGGFMVKLRAIESERIIFEISMLLPTNESANLVCKNWPKSAPDVYQDVFSKLAKA